MTFPKVKDECRTNVLNLKKTHLFTLNFHEIPKKLRTKAKNKLKKFIWRFKVGKSKKTPILFHNAINSIRIFIYLFLFIYSNNLQIACG